MKPVRETFALTWCTVIFSPYNIFYIPKQTLINFRTFMAFLISGHFMVILKHKAVSGSIF